MRVRSNIVLAAAAGLLAASCGPQSVDTQGGPVAGWAKWGGDEAGTRHSINAQITPENVKNLKVAWTYQTGDVWPKGLKGQPTFEATPIIAQGTMYLCSGRNRIIALDPATGEQKWVYDAKPDTNGATVIICRGVSYWEDKQAATLDGPCATRIFAGTIDGRLIALDARTGKKCPGFGQDGEIALKGDLGPVELPGLYGVSSAPTIVDDMVITGSKIIDFRNSDMPSGVVRAFDARTGAVIWAWTGAPPNMEVPKEGYPRSTPNVWAPMSVDAKRRLIFLPTGNPQIDFYSKARGELDHYGSSVVALNVDTGKIVWNYQLVHRDIWDYDTPAQPLLFDFKAADGAMIPALAQATKMGYVFVLNRETGKPIFPVDEKPVPTTGGVEPDRVSKTQPIPRLPEHLRTIDKLTEDDMFGFTPIDKAACVKRFRELRNDGIFTPIGTKPTLIYPVTVGGSNWGGLSYDPDRNLLLANSTSVAGAVSLVPRETKPGQPDRPSMVGTPYTLKFENFLSPWGAPCNKPPWGKLTALDMATGKKKWEVPLGTTRDQAPWPIWVKLGVPNQGGTMNTASGLTFIGATSDNFVRAFATDTGKELWKARLPAGGQAIPMTYRLGPNGKQYVVIAAGGHGALGTTPGDYLVAYTLR